MTLFRLELHHYGVRVQPDAAEEALRFYRDVLGLATDTGRPDLPDLPGYWMDCANDTQIHLMGVSGTSALARRHDQDPVAPHVAFGVPSIAKARRELDEAGVSYWTLTLGPGLEQLFMHDPSGNLVELHEIGTCRCRRTLRSDP